VGTGVAVATGVAIAVAVAGARWAATVGVGVEASTSALEIVVSPAAGVPVGAGVPTGALAASDASLLVVAAASGPVDSTVAEVSKTLRTAPTESEEVCAANAVAGES
jgi:hypothetical protein